MGDCFIKSLLYKFQNIKGIVEQFGSNITLHDLALNSKISFLHFYKSSLYAKLSLQLTQVQTFSSNSSQNVKTIPSNTSWTATWSLAVWRQISVNKTKVQHVLPPEFNHTFTVREQRLLEITCAARWCPLVLAGSNYTRIFKRCQNIVQSFIITYKTYNYL